MDTSTVTTEAQVTVVNEPTVVVMEEPTVTAAEADNVGADAVAPTATVTLDTTTPSAGVYVGGMYAHPDTHVFRDGQPVLKADGTPKLKPGRKTGISPHKKADVPATTTVAVPKVTAPEPTRVPLSVGTADAVPATLSEVETAAALAIATMSHSKEPLGVAVQRAATTATVSRAYGNIGAAESKDETLDVRTFVTQPASVEVGYGLTLNIGNYESARVDVKVSVPCYREETDAAYEWARTWVEERIRKEAVEIKNISAGQKSSPF